MLRIAVLGCGRIGQMHAANVARHPRATLAGVYDLHKPSADIVAKAQGVCAFASAAEVFASPDVDAVLIATATPTHADYIELAIAAGKAVLCEKPIDLNLARVEACAAQDQGKRAAGATWLQSPIRPRPQCGTVGYVGGRDRRSAPGHHHFT